MDHLHILFYDAAYWPAFGSIFPTVDICSLIPAEEADVAILEEPEHLNWFRVPDLATGGPESTIPAFCAKAEDVLVDDSPKKNALLDNDSSEHTELLDNNTNEKDVDNVVAAKEEDGDETIIDSSPTESEQKLNELGWAHKFNFVVGVIHTNYTAYIKQYGIGSTIVGAPAINAMSKMVVQAYCHKVVRLSGVIPSYAKWKEVTCNVHGVRGDFLEKAPPQFGDDKEPENCAPIYFIGKLLWAKGFDSMLKVQESFRRSNKEYFPIDVYGEGPDELEIKRAFHGRLQPRNADEREANMAVSPVTTPVASASGNGAKGEDEEAAEDIFSRFDSIRSQLRTLSKSTDDSIPKPYSNAKNYINAGFEVVQDDDASPSDFVVMERRQLVDGQTQHTETVDIISKPNPGIISKPNPLSILSDVSGKSLSTGIATTRAVKNLAGSALKTGLAITFTQKESEGHGDNGDGDRPTSPSYRFDPPKTIYELRRTPIPARFLGVMDHALLRDMPYKIFLNPSVTEVLCTTTAEALAMGKFAIIPKHTSNEFFLQFSNCLAYETMRECVEKIQWALENDPVPLTEEEAHIFTWHAATDRLIEAAIVTKREARERSKSGFDKADSRMAWIHSEGGKKGSFIKAFFGQTIDKVEDTDS